MNLLSVMTLSYALIIIIVLLLLPNEAVESKNSSCEDRKYCGNVEIEQPFGIGNDCSLNSNFSVYCDTSFDPPRPFVESSMLEIISIRPLESKIEVMSPVLSYCSSVSSPGPGPVHVWPFWFSHTDNVFGAVGCENVAILTKEISGGGGGGGDRAIVGGCMSFCGENGTNLNGSRGLGACHGLDCCVTTVPSPLRALSVKFQGISLTNSSNDDMVCGYAFMGKKEWLESIEPNISTVDDLLEKKYVPAVLDWVVVRGDLNGWCPNYLSNYSSVCGLNAYCSNSSHGDGYVCFCQPGYTGNPYSECTDVDECLNTGENRPCGHGMVCRNTEGGYSCSIPYEYFWILALVGQGCGLMVALACICWVDREFRKWRKKRLRKMCFIRNGGPLLEKELCSCEETVKRIEIFTSKELKKATEDYNQKRILGQGGQGTVYKGMLTDGRIVAVKMSKQIVNPSKAQQFVNEILVLSRINHRNVVKVLGCCLETKFPLLVYEFVPNGTLFQYIQDRDEKYFNFSWDVRLQIAAEVAMALCYLHSQASTSIFHRDVKSTNVLLDQNFRAKVADFGISMLVPADQTHKTTMVRGTHGYLDPEYFRTSQFTDKSDVYSFGVVLVELLTGLKPVFSGSGADGDLKALVSHFEASMENCRFLRIVDSRVVEAATKAEIMCVANLARKCLNLTGKDRPTMKEVVMELEGTRIKRSKASLLCKLGRKRTESVISNLCNPYI